MQVLAASRADSAFPDARLVRVPRFTPDTDWSGALDAVDVVLHCAGLTPGGAATQEDFMRVNRDSTVNLARQAGDRGVRHFIFVSTAQVHGSVSTGRPFDERSPADPLSPYAVSKWQAEQVLEAVSKEMGLAVTIVRPPLIYGPGVKGNLAQLAKISRLPLPLASVTNQRSLVALDNLTDFLVCLANRHAVGCETYLIADGYDLSTPEIIAHMARDQGRKAPLFAFPPKLMTGLLQTAGRGAMAERLFGSFQIDIAKARNEIGWKPVTTPDTAPWT